MTLKPIACITLAVSIAAIAHTAPAPKAAAPAQPDRHLSRADMLVREALSYRGVRYRFGGTTRSGIDCSALTQAVCRKWGMLLPRTALEQHTKGISIAKSQLRPGDLVFFKNTYKKGISHVGIYVGDGKFVHAASTKLGVIVSSLSSPHYVNHWAGARRLALDKEPINPNPPVEHPGDLDSATDSQPLPAPRATVPVPALDAPKPTLEPALECDKTSLVQAVELPLLPVEPIAAMSPSDAPGSLPAVVASAAETR